MTKNEGEVYFKLTGEDFDPDEITRELGIEPTRTRRKGNPIPRYSSWHYSVGKIVDETVDIYEVSTPAIGFDSKTIAFLNNVGATIDIDTYKC